MTGRRSSEKCCIICLYYGVIIIKQRPRPVRPSSVSRACLPCLAALLLALNRSCFAITAAPAAADAVVMGKAALRTRTAAANVKCGVERATTATDGGTEATKTAMTTRRHVFLTDEAEGGREGRGGHGGIGPVSTGPFRGPAAKVKREIILV